MRTSECYLLCFSRRLAHAGHYLGSTSDLPARLKAHRLGRAARLTQVLAGKGIGWKLARVWPGGREREKRLKARKNGPKLCPHCNPRL